jgi:hypothetical protein
MRAVAQLTEMARVIDAEKSDLYGVLAHVVYALLWSAKSRILSGSGRCAPQIFDPWVLKRLSVETMA